MIYKILKYIKIKYLIILTILVIFFTGCVCFVDRMIICEKCGNSIEENYIHIGLFASKNDIMEKRNGICITYLSNVDPTVFEELFAHNHNYRRKTAHGYNIIWREWSVTSDIDYLFSGVSRKATMEYLGDIKRKDNQLYEDVLRFMSDSSFRDKEEIKFNIMNFKHTDDDAHVIQGDG